MQCRDDATDYASMSEDLRELIEDHQIEKPVIIGHSMGGYVALAFAEKYPAMIKGLGLFHSSAFPDTAEGKANRAKAIEAIEKNHSGFIMNFIPDLFAPAYREILKKEILNP